MKWFYVKSGIHSSKDAWEGSPGYGIILWTVSLGNFSGVGDRWVARRWGDTAPSAYADTADEAKEMAELLQAAEVEAGGYTHVKESAVRIVDKLLA